MVVSAHLSPYPYLRLPSGGVKETTLHGTVRELLLTVVSNLKGCLPVWGSVLIVDGYSWGS